MDFFRPIPKLTALVVAALLCCLPTPGFAQTDAELIIPEITLGDSNFSLQTDAPCIPTDGGFSWQVEVRPGKKVRSMSLRFDLLRENGALIFRKTRYLNKLNSTESSTKQTQKDKKSPARRTEQREILHYERELTGLGMPEGTYLVNVAITMSLPDEQVSASLKNIQVVYDPDIAAQKVLPVLHMTAPPGRNAAGTFLANPATGIAEARRAQVERLAAWTTADKKAQLTLALSPLLLEEWADVADGYRFIDTQGNEQEAGSQTQGAAAYARTLAALKAALATKRLQLATLGYGDPDLIVLRKAGLAGDLTRHYRRGAEVFARVLDVTPGALTAPLHGVASAEDLAETETYFSSQETSVAPEEIALVLSHSVVKGKNKKNGASALRLGTHSESRALIANEELSSALLHTEVSDVLDSFLSQRQERKAVVVSATYPVNATQMELLTTQLIRLSAYPWLKLSAATDAAFSPEAQQSIRLPTAEKNEEGETELPKGWSEITRARRMAEGLDSALPEPDKTAAADINLARNASLAAEAGCGTNPLASETEEPSEAALALAYAAQEHAKRYFDNINLALSAITLSGSAGKLPITINNDTGQTLRLRLRLSGATGIRITPAGKTLELPPNETFVESDVELRNIVSGNLKAQLVSGSYLIAEKSVRVSASYTDKIGIILVVTIAGTVLATYVWRRNRVLPESKEVTEEVPEHKRRSSGSVTGNETR